MNEFLENVNKRNLVDELSIEASVVDSPLVQNHDVSIRLTHIQTLGYEHGEWLNTTAIAKHIGVGREWVLRVSKQLGIEKEPIVLNGQTIPGYPPFALSLLQDEFEWRRGLRELPTELTIPELAEQVGRSRGWTNRALEGLEVKPCGKVKRSRKESYVYRKSALKKLRDLCLEHPMEDGWYNMGQLSLLVDADREWVEGRLSEMGVVPEVRRSSLTGKILLHYPPHVVSVIKRAKHERPAVSGERWHTAEGIRESVGKSENWCRLRLRQFKDSAVIRQDSNGVNRIQYPQSVLDLLKTERDNVEKYPEAGDFITFTAAAVLIRRSEVFAQEFLDRHGVKGEIRRDGKGRPREHYSAEIIRLALQSD